jgi:hypothetical protein
MEPRDHQRFRGCSSLSSNRELRQNSVADVVPSAFLSHFASSSHPGWIIGRSERESNTQSEILNWSGD